MFYEGVKLVTQTNDVVAIIPARGGSKGIPKKNIQDFGGEPLISYTIKQALNCDFSRVLVVTDDSEIAEVARTAGAEVPFMRPKNISGDAAHMFLVYKHTLDWLKKQENYEPLAFACLLATTPFRKQKHLEKAIAMLRSGSFDWVYTTTECEHHPYRAMEKLDAEHIQPFFDLDASMMWANRQELPPLLRFNGAIISGLVKHVYGREEYNVTKGSGLSVGYISMEQIESLDIDTPLDLDFVRYVKEKFNR